MEKYAGAEVKSRFAEALIDGAKTSDEDARAIESALFEWCSANDCINYAHWCERATVEINCACVPFSLMMLIICSPFLLRVSFVGFFPFAWAAALRAARRA